MAVSVQEAVRLAKEALGEAPAPDMATWIATNLGLTVKPVIVTVMLGSLLEREHLERTKQAAMEMIEKAKAEERPKEKKARAGRTPFAQAVQCPTVTGEQTGQKPGCPTCGSGDYVFRGRKKIARPDEGPVMETKHACRGCGCLWTIRVPV